MRIQRRVLLSGLAVAAVVGAILMVPRIRSGYDARRAATGDAAGPDSRPRSAAEVEMRLPATGEGTSPVRTDAQTEPPRSGSAVVVLDAVNGTPLEDARLGAGPWTGPDGTALARTDADGRSALPDGTWIWFHKDGYAPIVLERDPLDALAKAQGSAEVRLPPFGELVVEVVDGAGNEISAVAVRIRCADTSDQGRAIDRAIPRWIAAPHVPSPPIPGLPAELAEVAPVPGPPIVVAATDATGTFRWREAPVATALFVTVDGPIARQRKLVTVDPKSRRGHLRFTAGASGTITGRFVHGDRAAPREGVELYDRRGERTLTHSDADGVFRFEGVALGWVQLCSISAVGWRRELEVTGDHDLGDIELPRRVMVKGRILSADPVAAGALTMIGARGGMALWRAAVAPDGTFWMEGPAGELTLVLVAPSAPGIHTVWSSSTDYPWESFELPVDEHLARVALRFPDGLVPAGTPVQVTLTSDDSELPHIQGMDTIAFRRTAAGVVDEGGTATLAHLAPGEYAARVRAGEHAFDLGRVQFTKGETTTIDCRVAGAATLRVRAAGLDPIPEGTRVAFHQPAAPVRIALVAPDGTARFGSVPAGSAGLELTTAQGTPLAVAEVDVVPGHNEIALDASLASGLRGRVRDLGQERTAQLALRRWPSPTLPHFHRSLRADADGTFDFGVLAPGRYRLTANISDVEWPELRVLHTQIVTLPEGAELSLELAAGPVGWVEVEFHLEGEPLRTLAAAEVLGRGPAGELLHGVGRPGVDGTFWIPRLRGPTVHILTPGMDQQTWHAAMVELSYRYVAVDPSGDDSSPKRIVQVAGYPVELRTRRGTERWPRIQPIEIAGIDLTLGVNAFALAPLEITSDGARLAPLPAGSVLLVHDPEAALADRARRWTPNGAIQIRAD